MSLPQGHGPNRIGLRCEFAYGCLSVRSTSVPGATLSTGRGRRGFVEQMREIIFRPYWNIPSSIVRREILPDLAKDPGYLERHDMELVAGPSDQSPVVATNALNLAKLTAGWLRLRQRPGPDNSLGLIKFVFPINCRTSTCTPHQQWRSSPGRAATSVTGVFVFRIPSGLPNGHCHIRDGPVRPSRRRCGRRVPLESRSIGP